MKIREVLEKTRNFCPVQITTLKKGRTIGTITVESEPFLIDELEGVYPGEKSLSEEILNKEIYQFGTKMVRDDYGDVVKVALEIIILETEEKD